MLLDPIFLAAFNKLGLRTWMACLQASPLSCSRWMQRLHREQIVVGFGPSFCSNLKENRLVVSRTGGL